jgi:hypothetical protein
MRIQQDCPVRANPEVLPDSILTGHTKDPGKSVSVSEQVYKAPNMAAVPHRNAEPSRCPGINRERDQHGTFAEHLVVAETPGRAISVVQNRPVCFWMHQRVSDAG